MLTKERWILCKIWLNLDAIGGEISRTPQIDDRVGEGEQKVANRVAKGKKREKRKEKSWVWYVGHVRGTAANVCWPHKLTAASDFT